MMKKLLEYEVSETEREILEYLWENPQGVIFKDIVIHFNDHKKKEWKKQTVNTFLMRLIEKGVITGIKEGTRKTYRAVFDEKEYEAKKAESILKSYYGGSLKKFLAALSGGEKINKETAEELRSLLK